MTTAETGLTIAGNLRAELGRQNRKKSELALLLGISPAAVTRRVSGETPLDVNELCAIAAWLNVPVTTLLPAAEGPTESLRWDFPQDTIPAQPSPREAVAA